MRENGTNDVRLASADDKSGGLRMSGKKDIVVKDVRICSLQQEFIWPGAATSLL